MPSRSHEISYSESRYNWEVKEGRSNGEIVYLYDDDNYPIFFSSTFQKVNMDIDAPDFPPMLEIQNLKYSNLQEGGSRLSAGSQGYIEFDVLNNGRGPAYNIYFKINNEIPINKPSEEAPADENTSTENKELNFQSGYLIRILLSEKTYHVKIPIKAKISAESKIHKFTILGSEHFGFDPDSKNLNLEVFEISTPFFIVKSISIDDDKEGNSFGNSNGVIEKGETVEIKIEIKNDGNGIGEDFKAELTLDSKLKGFFLPKSNNRYFQQTSIQPGETIEMSLYFYTNKKVKEGEIPLTLKVTEKTGEFPLTQKLNLEIKEIKGY